MILPATAAWLHHSVTEPTGNPAADMRLIEKIGMDRFGQFSYSYCVHPSGTVLEGCGDRVGAHTAGKNSTSFGICWMGDYTTRLPKVQQIDATRELIAELILKKWLRKGIYPTGGHRDVQRTVCPGDKLYAILGDLRVPWTGPKGVVPMFDPPIPIAAWCLVDYGGGGLVAVTPSGDVYCEPASLYKGAPAGKPYWGDREAARIEPFEDRYRITAVSGETYADF
jgi:hypothetical protein